MDQKTPTLKAMRSNRTGRTTPQILMLQGFADFLWGKGEPFCDLFVTHFPGLVHKMSAAALENR